MQFAVRWVCVCAHSLYLSTAHLLWMRNRARGWHFRHAYVVKEFVFAADKNATSINMLKAFSRLYIATLFNYKTRQTFDFKVNSPPANFSCIRWNRIFFRSLSPHRFVYTCWLSISHAMQRNSNRVFALEVRFSAATGEKRWFVSCFQPAHEYFKLKTEFDLEESISAALKRVIWWKINE